jgi:TonB family protein
MMKLPSVGRTANDRMKAGSRARLHWSIVASVSIHVGLVVGWPDLSLDTLGSGGEGAAAIQLVTLGSLPAPAPRDTRAPLRPLEVPALEAPETDAPGAGGPDEEERRSDGAPAGWEGRRSELWRLAALGPGIVPPAEERSLDEAQPDSTTRSEASDGEADDGVAIRQRIEELEYQRLTEEERLSLERLSALRPELVLASPASWLVLRNPEEVSTFLASRLQERVVDAGPRGSLSVSLWVDEHGSVEWAEINRSSGSGHVDQTALTLFRDVVAFRPAREEGMRVPVAAIFWLMW